MLFVAATITWVVSIQAVRVKDVSELQSALANARPGTRVLLAPGDYRGGLHFKGLKGSQGAPIVIAGAEPTRPPRFIGGGSGLQLSAVSHVELRNLTFEGATGNGLNIDDGGTGVGSTHHVTLDSIRVQNIPPGNRDAIKLSGIDDFVIQNCELETWGGSGIDMVGCHRGLIQRNRFLNGGDSGIQCKGGTSSIRIENNRFEHAGQRGVNIGGSTGLQFFRPSIRQMPTNGRYEAKDIQVFGNVFHGSMSPIAFVGVDGATVRFNTIYMPERWAIRILQETREPGFVPSRKGIFESNLVVFESRQWASGGVNVGSGTAPETFVFRGNFWYCQDLPRISKPVLPVAEAEGIYGLDPQLSNPPKELGVKPGSPATKVGAHAWK